MATGDAFNLLDSFVAIGATGLPELNQEVDDALNRLDQKINAPRKITIEVDTEESGGIDFSELIVIPKELSDGSAARAISAFEKSFEEVTKEAKESEKAIDDFLDKSFKEVELKIDSNLDDISSDLDSVEDEIREAFDVEPSTFSDIAIEFSSIAAKATAISGAVAVAYAGFEQLLDGASGLNRELARSSLLTEQIGQVRGRGLEFEISNIETEDLAERFAKVTRSVSALQSQLSEAKSEVEEGFLGALADEIADVGEADGFVDGLKELLKIPGDIVFDFKTSGQTAADLQEANEELERQEEIQKRIRQEIEARDGTKSINELNIALEIQNALLEDGEEAARRKALELNSKFTAENIDEIIKKEQELDELRKKDDAVQKQKDFNEELERQNKELEIRNALESGQTGVAERLIEEQEREQDAAAGATPEQQERAANIREENKILDEQAEKKKQQEKDAQDARRESQKEIDRMEREAEQLRRKSERETERARKRELKIAEQISDSQERVGELLRSGDRTGLNQTSSFGSLFGTITSPLEGNEQQILAEEKKQSALLAEQVSINSTLAQRIEAQGAVVQQVVTRFNRAIDRANRQGGLC